jgi:cytochrome c oxidase subunit 4
MATSIEETAAEAPHVEKEHAHPPDLEYVIVALFLALVTGAEVGLYYLDIDFVPYAVILVIAMVVKFSTVAMFFMHLRFDSRVFRWVFVTGIVLAVVVYTVVLLTFHVFNGRA